MLISLFNSCLERVTLPITRVTSQSHQKGGSTFATSNEELDDGVGLFPHARYYDCTKVFGGNGRAISPFDFNICKDDDSVNRIVKCMNDGNLVLVNYDLSKISETKESRNVQEDLLQKLASVLSNDVVNVVGQPKELALQLSFMQLNILGGITSESSKMDGYVVAKKDNCKNVVMSNLEVKDSLCSTVGPARQSFCYCSNIAINLLNYLPWNEIMVPSVVSNGHLYQFGAVMLLEPSFPYFVTTSKVLDATDAGELRIIATYFVNMISYLSSTCEKLQVPRAVVANPMELDTTKYYLKSLSSFFPARGELHASVHHFLRVLQKLYDAGEATRQHFVFPLCIRTRSKEPTATPTSFVFPNLHDYHIGFPTEKSHRDSYVVELTNIVTMMHGAGVVHLDLYPSNIMWKPDDAKVKMMIIDLDSAHFVDERVHENVTNRLERYKNDRNITANTLVDLDLTYIKFITKAIRDNVENLNYGDGQTKYILDTNFFSYTMRLDNDDYSSTASVSALNSAQSVTVVSNVVAHFDNLSLVTSLSVPQVTGASSLPLPPAV